MTGRIIKGIAGFYYVCAEDGIQYECKAKGIFRNRNEKPLVGDLVKFEITDSEKMCGNVTEILPRTNSLIRPEVSNVDQAVVVFSAAEPVINHHLLNSFLVMMELRNVPVILCINKADLVSENELLKLKDIYGKCTSEVVFVSAKCGTGFKEVKSLLSGKLTVLAGPSGVGKSSIMNIICPNANAQTGDISKKLGRGKHTTRHSEVFHMPKENAFVIDTPGFSSLMLPCMETAELKRYFPEMAEYEGQCRFLGCIHENEPGCMVKEALNNGIIAKERYESYILMLNEIRQQKRW